MFPRTGLGEPGKGEEKRESGLFPRTVFPRTGLGEFPSNRVGRTQRKGEKRGKKLFPRTRLGEPGKSEEKRESWLFPRTGLEERRKKGEKLFPRTRFGAPVRSTLPWPRPKNYNLMNKVNKILNNVYEYYMVLELCAKFM